MASVTATSAEPEVAVKAAFETDTQAALRRVRHALATFVAAVPGDLRRPTDLQRALGVDSKICWQIFNVIRSDETLAPAIHVPTVPAVGRIVASAKACGVPESLIESMLESLQSFERVVDLHASTRPDFDAMVAALVPDHESTGQIELKHRRSVYRGLSHIWGVQVDRLCTATFMRRRSPGATDRLIISVKHGLRRLRPQAHIGVYGYRTTLNVSDPPPDTQAIEPEAMERFGAPLVPDLCSQPLPRLRTHTARDGSVQCELAGKSIGLLSDLDLAFGTLSRGVPDPKDIDGRPWLGSNVLLTSPTGMLVTDLLLHRESFGDVAPELIVFANNPATDAPSEMTRFALPLREKVVSLGRADLVPPLPESPDITKNYAHACARVGWDLGEFDCYRVTVQFPVLHSVVRLFTLMDR